MSPFNPSISGVSPRFGKPIPSPVKFGLPLLAAVCLFFACDLTQENFNPQNPDDENRNSQTSPETEAPDAGGEIPELVRYAPKKTEGVPADFENGLWLQHHFKELKRGETAMIYPRRVPEGVVNMTMNDLYYPKFNFEIVAGNGVISIEDNTISAENQNGQNPGAKINPAKVAARKTGIAVVKITYDAFTHRNGNRSFPPISEINAGYVIFSVNGDDASDINIVVNTGIRNPYDTVYFSGDARDWPITVSAEGAKKIEVVLNGDTVTGSGGNYILPLKNTQNIIGVKATDAAGKKRFYYTAINARKIEITVTPEIPEAGKTFGISFKGITLPVHKLATIYNPGLGSNATVVSYKLSGTEYKSKSRQYQLATDNTITVNGLAAGTHTFTEGRILQSWFGDLLESEKDKNLPGAPNMNAITRTGTFSVFPDFTVTVR